jgi:hypothetical protein
VSRIVYNAPPTVAEFMRSPAFIRGLMGPFGSGKSVGVLMELLRRAKEQEKGKDGIRRTRYAIVRNSYPELRDTTRRTFEDWVPGAKQQAGWSESEFSYTFRDGDVESEFLFRALDRPEQVKKLLSLELTGAWINEAREVPYQVVKMLVGRLRRYPSMRDGGPTWSGLVMDTNPPDDDSWWYKMFEEQDESSRELGKIACFKQPGGRTHLAENLGHWEDARGTCVGHFPHDEIAAKRPGVRWVKHLAPEYYTDLAIVNAADPLWVKIHVDAQYGPTMSGRPVYPEFRDDVHSVEPSACPPLTHAPLLLGMDFGLTPALAFGQVDPKDGQLQIIDELVAQDLGAVRFAEDAARYIKIAYPGRPIRGTGDPAGEQRVQTDERTPYDVVNAQGLPMSPAHTNDFTRRREAVARGMTRLTMLGRPAIVISRKCKVLRKAMNGGYAFKRVSAPGEERFRDVPDKNSFSHVAEALQYLALGEGLDDRALEESTDSRRANQRFKVKPAGAPRARR